MTETIVADLDHIIDFHVDFDALAKTNHEHEFVRTSFELLKEAAQLVTLTAAAVTTETEQGADRNKAILSGHLVRIVKLYRPMIRCVLDEHGGMEQMHLMRQFLDSVSILNYLLDDPDDTSRFDNYVFDSLVSEVQTLVSIENQVKADGNRSLDPVELRMISSIHASFAAAGVKREDIPSRGNIKWPNAERRMDLISPRAYVMYRLASSSIHGSWHELERNHLQYKDGKFFPNYDSGDIYAQPLFTMALFGAALSRDYLSALRPEAFEVLGPRLAALIAKVARSFDLHEDFKQANG
ncbi:DUF5677 domain-containing protein [Rhodococcus sp. JT-3]|uniref:DUF5677 domain-containing protein n=1 Tax=Rhodococcus sp. JT-3 TaxID=1973213 RepID=UPI0013035D83|nr:DUF5677 domain-containing protein [Rhodococcus sp. JT-3]